MIVRLHIPKLNEIAISWDTAHFHCDARDKWDNYSGDQDTNKQVTVVYCCLFLSCLTFSKFNIFFPFCPIIEGILKINSLNLFPQKWASSCQPCPFLTSHENHFTDFYSLTVDAEEEKVGPTVRSNVRSSLTSQYFQDQAQVVAVNPGTKWTIASNGETITKLLIKPHHLAFLPFPAQRKRRKNLKRRGEKEIKPSSCTSHGHI